MNEIKIWIKAIKQVIKEYKTLNKNNLSCKLCKVAIQISDNNKDKCNNCIYSKIGKRNFKKYGLPCEQTNVILPFNYIYYAFSDGLYGYLNNKDIIYKKSELMKKHYEERIKFLTDILNAIIENKPNNLSEIQDIVKRVNQKYEK